MTLIQRIQSDPELRELWNLEQHPELLPTLERSSDFYGSLPSAVGQERVRNLTQKPFTARRFGRLSFFLPAGALSACVAVLLLFTIITPDQRFRSTDDTSSVLLGDELSEMQQLVYDDPTAILDSMEAL